MRKTKQVLIDWGGPTEGAADYNRDHGKRFLITEMPAAQAEKWAMRLSLAMTKSGLDMPDGVTHWGAILAYGIMKGIGMISWSEAEPLLDEMFSCIQIVEEKITRPPIGDDISEVQTRLRLRSEVFELHSGFSPADILSQLAGVLLREKMFSPPMSISHPLSEPQSPAERQH